MGIQDVLNPSSANISPQKPRKIQYTTPAFRLHAFTAEVVDKKVLFQVIKMVDSIMIFINATGRMILCDLSLGMFNARTMDQPVATKVMGNFSEETSKNMALKLAKKLGKTVYVSYNLEDDQLMLPAVERRLCEEIKNKPDSF